MKPPGNENSLKKEKPKNEDRLSSRMMSKEEQLEEFASIIVDIYFELYHEKKYTYQPRRKTS